MSGIDHPNMEHYAQQQAADYNHFIRTSLLLIHACVFDICLVRQNWTSGILRDEAAMLNALG